MCGIAGALSIDAGSDLDVRKLVSDLNSHQSHRGPDGEGLWGSEHNEVVLGHRRLAIIDTGATGAQPMSDVSGRWTITFNGEIYNYKALRSELEDLGVVFRTHSDTEVLINSVAVWGEAALQKLRGMFAFALWDNASRELWLARDPHGIKPLYYGEGANVLWFASEARVLSKVAPVNVKRDAAAVVGLFLWGHVPEPFSWWSGIKMLPAGHVWRIRAGKPVGKAFPYLRIEALYLAGEAKPLAKGELKQLVTDSVAHHLVADVDVGVFLSAGIDSGVVAGLSAEMGRRPKTVTLAFKEYRGTSNDESVLAEETARAIGADHTTVCISEADFEALFERFFQSMDSPSIDGLNSFLISYAAASQGLKVALSGLGADEMFGGYPSFHQIPRLVRYGSLVPARLARTASYLLSLMTRLGVPPKVPGLPIYSSDLSSAFLLRRSVYLKEEMHLLLDQSWIASGLERLDTTNRLEATIGLLRNSTSRAQISALESTWYMRNQLLRDTDWASMAHSLEVRLPFVDVPLLRRIAPAISSDQPPTKSDLAACSSRLPDAIRRRSKTGFSTPVAEWTKGHAAKSDRGLRGWAKRVQREFTASNAASSRAEQ